MSLRGGPFLRPVQSSAPGKKGHVKRSGYGTLQPFPEATGRRRSGGPPCLAPAPGPHSLLPSARSNVTSKLPLRGLAGFTFTVSSGACRRSAWLRAAALRP